MKLYSVQRAGVQQKEVLQHVEPVQPSRGISVAAVNQTVS